MAIGPIRTGHLTFGLVLFASGLILALANGVLVIEFIKGAMQPVTLLAAMVALLAAFLGRREFRSFNAMTAGLLLVVGGWGLYDEFYAVLDFVNGFLPLFLTGAGAVAVTAGIRKLR